MKLLQVFPFKLLIPALLLLGFLFFFLIILFSHRITFQTESFPESNASLSNPYQGFYHIMGYTLSENEYQAEEYIQQAKSYQASLVLMEINLKNYRTGAISDHALNQLNDIFTAWSQSPAHTQIILRFLYDWDGLALVTEPDSLDTILKHIDQVSDIVNEHHSSVYIMQGIFLGNWGEMHHSHFMDETSVKTLINHLHESIDPSIYLSVRTPAQWRMINNIYDAPKKYPAFGSDDSLLGRLGLYNDGMLGSESDLGTYGNTERKNATSPSYQGTRKEELAFQNQICRYVPNGGEVIYNETLNELKSAVSDLRTMHVSYLNSDYDGRAIEKWRSSTWTESDAFCGCDGYTYVKEHLGYRYVLRSCNIKKSGYFHPDVKLSFTIENEGFSNTLKPFQVSIQIKDTKDGKITSIPVKCDLRRLGSGEKKTYHVTIPVKEIWKDNYAVYLLVKDETNNQMIRFGNENTLTVYGYKLGELEY